MGIQEEETQSLTTSQTSPCGKILISRVWVRGPALGPGTYVRKMYISVTGSGWSHAQLCSRVWARGRGGVWAENGRLTRTVLRGEG